MSHARRPVRRAASTVNFRRFFPAVYTLERLRCEDRAYMRVQEVPDVAIRELHAGNAIWKSLQQQGDRWQGDDRRRRDARARSLEVDWLRLIHEADKMKRADYRCLKGPSGQVRNSARAAGPNSANSGTPRS